MALLFSERGGGTIGGKASGTWPFAKLEIYDDKIVLKVLFFTVEIPPDSVRYVERVGGIPIICDVIYLKLDNPNLPSSVTFASFFRGAEIEETLKKICKHLLPPRAWYKNPYKAIAIVAWPAAAYVLLHEFFHLF